MRSPVNTQKQEDAIESLLNGYEVDFVYNDYKPKGYPEHQYTCKLTENGEQVYVEWNNEFREIDYVHYSLHEAKRFFNKGIWKVI